MTQGQRMPPTDISAEDFLAKLLERPQPSEVLDFPARSTNGTPLPQIRMMVLQMEQHDEARVRARKFLKEVRKLTDEDLASKMGESLLGDATARELIAMATMMVKPIDGTEEDNPRYPLIFRTARDVNKLTADEVTALFGAYLLVQRHFGPYEREMDEFEVNAWVSRLEAGGAAYPLGSLQLHQLGALCLSLSARAYALSKLLSSPPESWPEFLASLPESWGFTTTSSTEQPAESSPSPSDDGMITPEQAMAAARAVIGRDPK